MQKSIDHKHHIKGLPITMTDKKGRDIRRRHIGYRHIERIKRQMQEADT